MERRKVNIAVRAGTARLFCLAFFILLGTRLWFLQIQWGEFYQQRSENNRLRTVYLTPPRGRIFDRKGEVLSQNRPAFNVDLVVEDSPDPKKTLADLAEILELDREEVLKSLHYQRKRNRFEPKLILKDVSRDQLARISAQTYRLPGISISVSPARSRGQAQSPLRQIPTPPPRLKK